MSVASAVAVIVASALAAAVSTVWAGQVAYAQAPAPMNVQLPPQGMVFRASNGRVVARLRGDANGGALELLDAREEVAVRLRATSAGGSLDLGTARDPRPPTRLDIVRSAPEDPGY